MKNSTCELVEQCPLGYQAQEAVTLKITPTPPCCLCVEGAGMLFASVLLKQIVRILLVPYKQLSQNTLIGLGQQIPLMHPPSSLDA
jgi:hypothetical protein